MKSLLFWTSKVVDLLLGISLVAVFLTMALLLADLMTKGGMQNVYRSIGWDINPLVCKE